MKKIMFVGAGILQSYVIKRAKDLGYFTISVDKDKNAYGFFHSDLYKVIDIVDRAECLKYAQEMRIDGVITSATDYGVLTASYISEEMGLPGLHYSVAEMIKNKYYTRKLLAKYQDKKKHQFFQLSTIYDLHALYSSIHFPVMVKPCDGSGSKGISRAENIGELEKSFFEALKHSLSQNVIIETFINGIEYGVESFVLNDNIFILGIMKKKMTDQPVYAELGHCIPSGLSEETEHMIEKQVIQAIKTLGINFGAVNMDILLTKSNQVFIADIGARMGGNLIGSHIIPEATGIDYMANIIRAAVGDMVDFQPKINKKCIATRLLALKPGIVRDIPDLKQFRNPQVLDIILKLKKSDIIREYRNNLDSCGYVVVTGQNIEDAQSLAELIKKKIDKQINRLC